MIYRQYMPGHSDVEDLN